MDSQASLSKTKANNIIAALAEEAVWERSRSMRAILIDPFEKDSRD